MSAGHVLGTAAGSVGGGDDWGVDGDGSGCGGASVDTMGPAVSLVVGRASAARGSGSEVAVPFSHDRSANSTSAIPPAIEAITAAMPARPGLVGIAGKGKDGGGAGSWALVLGASGATGARATAIGKPGG